MNYFSPVYATCHAYLVVCFLTIRTKCSTVFSHAYSVLKRECLAVVSNSWAISKWRYGYYYGSTALRWALVAFSVSWSYTQSVRLLGRGISPSQDPYLHTEQHKHRIYAHRHPWLEWDSNPRSQRSNERRQFMPRGHYDRQEMQIWFI
jgi:hypothetical protein